MKSLFFLSIIGLVLVGLTGCYTVPRHYITQEIIVYYPAPPPPPPPPDYYYPPPPPSPPIYDPPAPVVTQPRDRQPVKPPDSYGTRDPIQGGNHRGGREINTVPPVRTPVQKDRGSQ